MTGPARGALGGDARGADALAYLRGAWRVQRRLVDHATGSIGSFEGVASFTAADDADGADSADSANGADGAGGIGDEPAVLAYHESGELRFRGYSGSASRDLIYRARSDGGADVCFADGREFYRLDSRSGSWRDQHLCGSDRYTVAGRLLGDDSFEERWRASGPRKDYETITTLVRTEMGAA